MSDAKKSSVVNLQISQPDIDLRKAYVSTSAALFGSNAEELGAEHKDLANFFTGVIAGMFIMDSLIEDEAKAAIKLALRKSKNVKEIPAELLPEILNDLTEAMTDSVIKEVREYARTALKSHLRETKNEDKESNVH